MAASCLVKVAHRTAAHRFVPRNRFAYRDLVKHADIRDVQSKSGAALPLRPTSRPKDERDGKGIARHRVGPFGHGSKVQQSDALDHHRRCQAEARSLTDQILKTVRRDGLAEDLTGLPAIG